MDLKQYIREIPDYPEKGVNFKDITTLLKDGDAFKAVVDQVCSHFEGRGITKVVSLESRGFIVGGALAYHLEAGFVPARKKGKLPAETIEQTYELEYGTDTIEVHLDALCEDDVVLIHDDLLATGGTALAALKLVQKMKVKQVFFSFICDLKFIENGNKALLDEYETHSVVTY
ncbi:adenine phosphoribosyltransferase [Mangrovibacterium marinum]|uniref:Adenine phosphoribosyltransferase n=1 Tax=Mangrovibacterium marinum TaxID=1639118 RepID=A0A2T5C2G8_9BACT|nr:adenine phosphoribosyltransferase [Mangrovibacterium marinum]PTN08925.1 adenine phosphoribosyltransferase [Mangrovibacterium marinum]